MSNKIDEIREKIEGCFDPEEKKIALNLCDALEFAITEHNSRVTYGESRRLEAKIDSILEKGR